MKKLKLNLDDLRVESFATTPDATAPPGTVFGQDTEDTICNTQCGTCTCGNTCGNTCANSCGQCTGGGEGCGGSGLGTLCGSCQSWLATDPCGCWTPSCGFTYCPNAGCTQYGYGDTCDYETCYGVTCTCNCGGT